MEIIKLIFDTYFFTLHSLNILADRRSDGLYVRTIHLSGCMDRIYRYHIWELPVYHYHEIMVIYTYPFLVVITLLFSCIIFINDCICILTGSPV